MQFRTIIIALALILVIALPLSANKVLIVSETGNASSPEAQAAVALLPGATVDVLPAATVSTIAATPGGLSVYRVVILADPGCGVTTPPVIPGAWGKDITGNVVIIGTDPAVHPGVGGSQGTQLIKSAMAYILSDTRTGALVILSCYYSSTFTPPNTPVPLLNDAFASSAGSFTVRTAPNCYNIAHITATHPALSGLTDTALSGWGCSVHEIFDDWPANFEVLAIAQGLGTTFTATDGTVGSPYILARGEDLRVLSDIALTPATATNEVGTSHTVTATITPPTAGVTVTFKVVAGQNVGLTGTGITNASGQATFTYSSSTVGIDFIQAQFTRNGVTQTSNTVRKEWILTPKSCMRILASSVRCEVDAAGNVTGNYVWTFRVQNQSGTPAAHLFLSGLPAGVTANPDHLVLNPTLGSGVSPVQQVVFSGVGPGPLSFTLSLHDQSLGHCCSTKVTLDLPRCDCAQMVREVTPSCFSFPFFSVPPPYRYGFTIQNLSPILAEKVLIAAVSPSDLLTPIPTSQLTVTKSVNDIPPTTSGGTAPALNVLLGGPLAVGGQKVCLNISINDKDIDDCCAITRCFTLPDCFRVIDDWKPFGGATFTAFERGFRVGGFGTTGEAGVRLDTDDARSVALAWQPLSPSLPNGAFLELRAAGDVGEPAGRLRVTKADARYQISTTVDGASTYRVEVYRGSELAGVRRGLGTGSTVVVWPVAGGAEVVELDGGNGGETLAFTLETATPVAWQLSDGTTLTGDRFRITPEQGSPQNELGIETFELRAANIPELVVTAVSVSLDCNGNGVADAEDIAAGTSLDRNANGLPDECDGTANTLMLNTGYDDGTRTTLAGGANDDDWEIVTPAPERPAKVIANPIPGWPAPFADSRWISAEPLFGLSVAGVTRHVFQRCFCLAENADAVTLDLTLRADDSAVVSLNGRTLDTGGVFFGAPLEIRRSGKVGDGLFVAGTNCLRVEVIDSGAVVTGFTLAGTVASTGDSCAPSHHDH